MQSISSYMEKYFRHFNARELKQAAQAYKQHIDKGGKMVLAMAGAMSTGELGVILSQMIREDKIHAISCTAANLEEDIYNLVGKNDYVQIPKYHCLSTEEETKLRRDEFNRVTDTAIPENVFKIVEDHFFPVIAQAEQQQSRYFPYEYIYQMLNSGTLQKYYQIPAEDSWVLAACAKNIPIYTPGWEDSTLGNTFAARVMMGKIANHQLVKSGTEQMEHLIKWYLEHQKHSLGFFQIGGGIAGDFAICVVPLILQDLKQQVKLWDYFAQISDSVTSYGSYSGAAPNEKITWYKLAAETPRFMINSDATIVAPLIFSYVLGQ